MNPIGRAQKHELNIWAVLGALIVAVPIVSIACAPVHTKNNTNVSARPSPSPTVPGRYADIIPISSSSMSLAEQAIVQDLNRYRDTDNHGHREFRTRLLTAWAILKSAPKDKKRNPLIIPPVIPPWKE